MTQPQQVVCEKCQHQFGLTEGLQSRPVGTDVTQIMVVCPNCNEAKHAYFETPNVVAARGRLTAAQQRYQQSGAVDKVKRWEQFKAQQSAYKRIFDAEQQRWRRKRNVKEAA